MKRLQCGAAAVFLVSCLASAAAPLARADDATLALPASSLLFAPAYIAEEKGFWRDHDLNLKTLVIAGPAATNAVLAGSAEFTMSGPGPMLRAVIAGQKLIAIGNTADRLMLEVVLRQDIAEGLRTATGGDERTRARALKGLKLGVDSINGFAHTYLRYIAGRYAINPETDFTVSPMQPPAMVPALKTKAVDGFVFSQPWTLMAEAELGAVTWFSSPAGDLPEMQPYAYNMLITRSDLCPNKPKLCRKMMAGVNMALAFIHDQPAETLAILKKRFPTMQDELVAPAFLMLKPTLPRTAEINEAGLKNAQDFSVVGGLIDAKNRIVDLKSLYTNDYVK